MSAVLKAAKISRASRAHPGVFARYHRGDPGILDSIWNGIKGAATGFIAGGPVGAILGGTQGLAGQKNAGTNVGSTLARLTSQPFPQSKLAAGGPGLPPLPPLPPMPGMPFGDPTRGNQTQSGAGGTDWDDRPVDRDGKQGCVAGRHWNKTGYWTKKYGYIHKGTVCVKNRKRNPLNPRAASRALGRLSSTRKAMRGIERLMNKIGGSRPRAVASFGRSNGRKKCGCR